MKKYNGFKKLKTAIFISGKGSNFNNLIKFSFKKNSPIKIELLITNNYKAKGLKFAKKYRIRKKIYKYQDKFKTEKKIISDLKKNKIKVICLAGFMKVLSKNFIKNFRGKILNIHPSLLPKYKGLNTHERAIKNKDKISGCTVHFVNSKIDSGKIIMQKKVRIFKTDTPKTLKNRILRQEHMLYPKAIQKVFSSL